MTVGFPTLAIEWPECFHASGQCSVVRNSEKSKKQNCWYHFMFGTAGKLQKQVFLTFVQPSKFP